MMRLWLSDAVLLFGLLLISELAFRIGRASPRRDEVTRSQLMTVQASTLGLLALLLGFTLSMGESRFTARRQALAFEAAAVGTTMLRTDFLPEPERTQSRDLLRRYITARHEYYAASNATAPAATRHAQAIHDALWARVAATAPDFGSSETFALYVTSLNEMIDLEGIRDLAVVARLPWTIRMVLLLLAFAAVAISSYVASLGGGRLWTAGLLLPVLIWVACTVIADLDRSREGFISTGDLPMLRLEQSFSHDTETSAR